MPSLPPRTLRHVTAVPGLQRLADIFAVSCSALCALHCLAVPALLIFVPVVTASIFGGESFHLAILWLILPTSLVALTLGCWRHKDRYVIFLCVAGLAAIVGAGLLGHELLGEAGERGLTLAGSLVLIAGHVRNFRLCRSMACPK
jgi:hypothetical protein